MGLLALGALAELELEADGAGAELDEDPLAEVLVDEDPEDDVEAEPDVAGAELEPEVLALLEVDDEAPQADTVSSNAAATRAAPPGRKNFT